MAAHINDHKQLLASLNDEMRLNLSEKSDLAGLLMLASHLAGIIATGWYIQNGFALWQLVLALHGIQLVFFFTLLHETSHDTPFRSLWLNRFAGRLSSLIIFLPPLWFRYYHMAHHRHTHDPDHDPELAGGDVETVGKYLLTVSGLPVWKFHFTTLFGNALGRVDYDYLPERVKPAVVKEARAMVIFYVVLGSAALYYSAVEVLSLWLFPLLLGQPFLRLYLMAEHGRCPHVANMLENSRTTFTNRFVRWLAWNMPYHAEHHANPNVPFHKLPVFHEVAKRHLRSTENGYSRFHQKQLDSFAKGESG